MNKHLRLHTGRRREAIDRLRSLTTGTFVAGLAGTIGFGFLAAATFTGTATAEPATDGTQPSTTSPFAGSGGSTGSGTSRVQGNATIPAFGSVPNPRPAPTHRSHASTGGSGG
jgi:hypothetical protein